MNEFIHAGYMTLTLSGDVLSHEERIEVGFNGIEYEAIIQKGFFKEGIRDKDLGKLELKVIAFLNEREERQVTRVKTNISDENYKKYESNLNEKTKQEKLKKELEEEAFESKLNSSREAGINIAKNSFAFLNSKGYLGKILKFILSCFMTIPYFALIYFSYAFQGPKGKPFRTNIYARSGGVTSFYVKLFSLFPILFILSFPFSLVLE